MESASYWNNNKEVRDFWTLWFSPLRRMQKERVRKMGMRNREQLKSLRDKVLAPLFHADIFSRTYFSRYSLKSN